MRPLLAVFASAPAVAGVGADVGLLLAGLAEGLAVGVAVAVAPACLNWQQLKQKRRKVSSPRSLDGQMANGERGKH